MREHPLPQSAGHLRKSINLLIRYSPPARRNLKLQIARRQPGCSYRCNGCNGLQRVTGRQGRLEKAISASQLRGLEKRRGPRAAHQRAAP